MAKVILVERYTKMPISDGLLGDNLTDEQARDLANGYNAKHWNEGNNYAQIVIEEKPVHRIMI